MKNIDKETNRLLYETLRIACFPVGVRAASRREERKGRKEKKEERDM
ncbi:hypothetical protein [Nostoc sp.]